MVFRQFCGNRGVPAAAWKGHAADESTAAVAAAVVDEDADEDAAGVPLMETKSEQKKVFMFFF